MNASGVLVRCPQCHTQGALCDMPALATIGKGFVSYVLHDGGYSRVCLLNRTDRDNLKAERSDGSDCSK